MEKPNPDHGVPVSGTSKNCLEPRPEVTLEDLVIEMKRSINRVGKKVDENLAIMMIFAERLSDVSHLSIDEAARFRSVTPKTIRNWLAAGKLTREIIPGTRRSGIPTEQVFAGWIDAEVAAQAMKRR